MQCDGRPPESEGIHDIRDVLRLLNIDWRTRAHLARLHALADQSLTAARQMIGAFKLTDTSHALPQATFDVWLQCLLQTAIEVQLFPDAVPTGATSWDGLARLWDDYLAHARKFHQRGVRQFHEGDRWSIRDAVKAAWNIEFASIASPVEVGPIAADSSHRAGLRCAPELWLAFQTCSEKCLDRPTDRPSLWDRFLVQWGSDSIQIQCERVRSRLALEFSTMCARIDGQGPAATATSAAAATAQAGIGNIIIQNQITIPPSTEHNRNGPGGNGKSAESAGMGARPAAAVGRASKPRRRGRKPDTDVEKDRRIAEAWDAGRYKTHAELERALGLPAGEAKRARDRHRHRASK